MSRRSTRAKVKFILEMIGNIEFIVKRHEGVIEALEDIEGQMAILMGISQIGETLQGLDDELIEKVSLVEEKKGAYYTRNYIVHEYDGVDLYLIENIVEVHLPIIKTKLLSLKLQ
jgi:uncharacterized protein with HEPN domain